MRNYGILILGDRMRICKVHENEIKIIGNRYFLIVSVGAAVMALLPVKNFIEAWIHQGYFTKGDIFVTVLAIPWVLFFLFGAFYCYLYGTGYIVMNNNGVKYHSLINNRFYSWAEIEDFGMSYCGLTGNAGVNTYYFYFSKNMLPTKSDDKKKIRGKVIKTMIFESDFQDFADEVIPFCKRFTSVEPFVPEIRFHFI